MRFKTWRWGGESCSGLEAWLRPRVAFFQSGWFWIFLYAIFVFALILVVFVGCFSCSWFVYNNNNNNSNNNSVLMICLKCVSCTRKRVNLSHNLFSHTVDNFEIISELPRPLVTAMAVDKSDILIICALFLHWAWQKSWGIWRMCRKDVTFGKFVFSGDKTRVL